MVSLKWAAGFRAVIERNSFMSILIKIGIGIGAVILLVGSALVTIAALLPPKEYKGDGKAQTDGDKWDESIEDV